MYYLCCGRFHGRLRTKLRLVCRVARVHRMLALHQSSSSSRSLVEHISRDLPQIIVVHHTAPRTTHFPPIHARSASLLVRLRGPNARTSIVSPNPGNSHAYTYRSTTTIFSLCGYAIEDACGALFCQTVYTIVYNGVWSGAPEPGAMYAFPPYNAKRYSPHPICYAIAVYVSEEKLSGKPHLNAHQSLTEVTRARWWYLRNGSARHERKQTTRTTAAQRGVAGGNKNCANMHMIPNPQSI